MQTTKAEILPPDRRQGSQKPKRKRTGHRKGYHPPKGVTPPGLIPWKPGQSGNPGGIPAVYKEVIAMARTAAPQAIARLIELVASPDDRVALMAADKLLERAWGKPKEIQDDKDKPALDFSRLKAADLQALRGIAERLRGADPAIPVDSQDSARTATVDPGVAEEPAPIAVDVPD